MREAFQVADPSIGNEEFLDVFQASGCYLVDLCAEPVDRMDARSRRAACLAGEETLSREIARLRPAMILTVVRSIEANVSSAVSVAEWNGPIVHLPYPGRWSHLRRAFVKELTPPILAV